jgi:hypothetical protein
MPSDNSSGDVGLYIWGLGEPAAPADPFSYTETPYEQYLAHAPPSPVATIAGTVALNLMTTLFLPEAEPGVAVASLPEIAASTTLDATAPAALQAGELSANTIRGSIALGENAPAFSMTPTAAGGELWTSSGNIVQSDFANLVQAGSANGQTVNLLTGVHGFANGTIQAAPEFFEADVAAFGNLPGVNIHDISTMTLEDIQSIISGPGRTIGGFCNSTTVLLPP